MEAAALRGVIGGREANRAAESGRERQGEDRASLML